MYNIPVALWILDTHPIHAPLCYVRPTPDMQIKVSQHVDGNGKIYLPYLHEWDAANSDILGLVQRVHNREATTEDDHLLSPRRAKRGYVIANCTKSKKEGQYSLLRIYIHSSSINGFS